METLPEQFSDTLKRIEISSEQRKHVIASHSEIRTYLETDELLSSWGVDTVLIGSYARHTAIHPGKDVDVFTKLEKLDTSTSPSRVYEAVMSILVAKYGDRAEAQARSIKVTFNNNGVEFAVDVVPAVHMAHQWGIPNHDVSFWVDMHQGSWWVQTDPEKLTSLTTEMNAMLDINGQGAYVPIVKLIRQTREHHLRDDKPGGFYFELMTYWAFNQGVKGDNFAELFASTLRSLALQLGGSNPLVDPALGQPYQPEPIAGDRLKAAMVFDSLASSAEQALSLKRCPAAVIWREILGTNSRGFCFPLPPGCDESGQEIKNVAAVASIGSGEASGFA